MKRTQWIGTVVVSSLLAVAGAAQGQTAVDIGGKTSVAGIATVTTVAPDPGDDSTTLLLGGVGAYTTEDGRWEFGGGLTFAGFYSNTDVRLWSITAQGRINSDAMGPEENVILYAGAIAGVGIVDGPNIEDEVGIFGPKVGGEIYLSPSFAVQLQDALLFDTEDGITNQLTLGFKVLFN